MAFNGFPATYQQYYPYYQQPAVQQQANNNLIWVQGEAGAKSYLVAPNNTVQLWDSERQTIYLKSADAAGMPSMKVLDYTIREAAQAAQADKPVTYATRDELDGILKQIRSLQAELDKLKEENDE